MPTQRQQILFICAKCKTSNMKLMSYAERKGNHQADLFCEACEVVKEEDEQEVENAKRFAKWRANGGKGLPPLSIYCEEVVKPKKPKINFIKKLEKNPVDVGKIIEKIKVGKIIKKIKEEIPFVDVRPYSHNIIGLQLTMLEDLAGKEAVFELVRTTELRNLGWAYVLAGMTSEVEVGEIEGEVEGETILLGK